MSIHHSFKLLYKLFQYERYGKCMNHENRDRSPDDRYQERGRPYNIMTPAEFCPFLPPPSAMAKRLTPSLLTYLDGPKIDYFRRSPIANSHHKKILPHLLPPSQPTKFVKPEGERIHLKGIECDTAEA